MVDSQTPESTDGTGRPIHPGTGVVPVLREIEKGRLRVEGTAFYITRYGLFLTAQHVLETLVDWGEYHLTTGFVLHLAGNEAVHLRTIRGATLLHPFDLAIGQAENYLEERPDDPLMNLRPTLTTEIPAPGSDVILYAYPENEVLDFTDRSTRRVIRGDYFEGQFRRYVAKPEHPYLPFPYFETTIELRPGASGAPVFDDRGRVIGVSCRGWDFRGGEHEGNNLSYAVPIAALFPPRIELLQLPAESWESKQIPPDGLKRAHTFEELAKFGHLQLDPGHA